MTDNDAPKSAAARLFDIRLLIGGLFLVYGVMLTVAGFLTSDAERKKAADININLWLGLGMVLVGIVFLVWLKLNPLRHEPPPEDRIDRTDTSDGTDRSERGKG
jgi:prolipoprotein diacylglyceryltransferase